MAPASSSEGGGKKNQAALVQLAERILTHKAIHWGSVQGQMVTRLDMLGALLEEGEEEDPRSGPSKLPRAILFPQIQEKLKDLGYSEEDGGPLCEILEEMTEGKQGLRVGCPYSLAPHLLVISVQALDERAIDYLLARHFNPLHDSTEKGGEKTASALTEAFSALTEPLNLESKKGILEKLLRRIQDPIHFWEVFLDQLNQKSMEHGPEKGRQEWVILCRELMKILTKGGLDYLRHSQDHWFYQWWYGFWKEEGPLREVMMELFEVAYAGANGLEPEVLKTRLEEILEKLPSSRKLSDSLKRKLQEPGSVLEKLDEKGLRSDLETVRHEYMSPSCQELQKIKVKNLELKKQNDDFQTTIQDLVEEVQARKASEARLGEEVQARKASEACLGEEVQARKASEARLREELEQQAQARKPFEARLREELEAKDQVREASRAKWLEELEAEARISKAQLQAEARISEAQLQDLEAKIQASAAQDALLREEFEEQSKVFQQCVEILYQQLEARRLQEEQEANQAAQAKRKEARAQTLEALALEGRLPRQKGRPEKAFEKKVSSTPSKDIPRPRREPLVSWEEPFKPSLQARALLTFEFKPSLFKTASKPKVPTALQLEEASASVFLPRAASQSPFNSGLP